MEGLATSSAADAPEDGTASSSVNPGTSRSQTGATEGMPSSSDVAGDDTSLADATKDSSSTARGTNRRTDEPGGGENNATSIARATDGVEDAAGDGGTSISTAQATNLEPLPPGTYEVDADGNTLDSVRRGLQSVSGDASTTATPGDTLLSAPPPAKLERRYEIIDEQEEQQEEQHYSQIIDMAQSIFRWLQKDDPHYIEVEKDQSVLLCQQYEEDCNIRALIKEYARTDELKRRLEENRKKQWHPPQPKHPTLADEYGRRLRVVFGEEYSDSARGQREITSQLRKWPDTKYHKMYLEQCERMGIAEEDIEPEYIPPLPPPPQYIRKTPRLRTVQWEYRKRMIDLYTRKGHQLRAENVDVEMLECRGREHLLYRQRCVEFDEHPLPVYKNLDGLEVENTKPQPQLMVDDVEVQFLGLTAMELLVTHANRHDVSVEMRRIAERGLGHPVALIDIASRSFLQMFDEAERRQEAEAKAEAHQSDIQRYCYLMKRLLEEYAEEGTPIPEDANELRPFFDDCEEGDARSVFIQACRRQNVDPDDFEEAIDEEDAGDDDDEDEDLEDETAAETTAKPSEEAPTSPVAGTANHVGESPDL
ncbi:unnamed protein product [Amoebophrya sp. A25]|nr:unnamed protein product [Amoebophrya sp. A25]|eukprot:GSA25T00013874001.1